MTLTVHHLSLSQSERIVFLCEELSIPYTLKIYPRSPVFAPPEYKALHPAGTAPIITDGDITLAESGAVTEYILHKYGDGKLQIPSTAGNKEYADYLYWLHFANGTLQPAVMRSFSFKQAKIADDNPMYQSVLGRRAAALKQMDDQLKENEWLAGSKFTAADVMSVVSMTTMRLFVPFGLEEYPNVVRWLDRVGRREGYRRAMEKGEPGLKPVLGVEAPKGVL
ncbi:hypothetical protein ACLMJK_004962 [Lecanora helva]